MYVYVQQIKQVNNTQAKKRHKKWLAGLVFGLFIYERKETTNGKIDTPAMASGLFLWQVEYGHINPYNVLKFLYIMNIRFFISFCYIEYKLHFEFELLM